MSFDKNGKKCTCCGAYLFDDDDVVCCPVCGAPHHRDCYDSLGHCALEKYHGTEQQYDKQAEKDTEKVSDNKDKNPQEDYKQAAPKIRCPACSSEYSVTEDRCPQCGAPRPFKVLAFDNLGGIPADMDLGDGVTAKEAAGFVMSNSQRYIPKFAAVKYGKKLSWNWLAFLFPPVWFLSRKMYKLGAFICALSVSFSMITVPFLSEFEQIIPSGTNTTYQVLAQSFADNISKFSKPALIAFFLACTAKVLLSVICGMFGDFFYRNYTISAVKKIRQESSDAEADTLRKGGVSIIAMAVGFVLMEYLPMFIINFAL